ncbi:testis-expressed protein 10 [Condylostylus longicornis]|uniref:testis-expressed protein 10 n=1 Tax=Condylostylus longicornis TaxID=2530218 RepID=UPI00244E4B0B|nr:testis-expressed protein 10 [Condylostylus longicornis]
MGGKHKKFLRSEKAKVKLKGAKLPKGLNITKTEFKVKKIILREQLQEQKFETGKKRHDIKDVLSRLKHHNVSFRTEALNNLRECLSYNSDEIFRNLSQIIHGLSMLSLDIEKEIRRQSFKVFTELFTIFESHVIEPFFNIISSYLKCSMSHLNHSIQEDSLLFLDVLLKYVPNLIMLHHNQIFINFLDMISKLRIDSKPGRMLTVNVDRKSTTIKWRSKILDKLQRLLQIIIKDWTSKLNSLSGMQAKPKEIFLGSNTFYLELYDTSASKVNFDLFNIFNKSVGQYRSDTMDNVEKSKKYIESLCPLLLEAWMEVRPNFSEEAPIRVEMSLSFEAAFTLNTVLTILEYLWEMVEICERKLNIDFSLTHFFQNSFASEFKSQIFRKFPYQQLDVGNKYEKKGKQKIPKDQISSDLDCFKLNLTLVYLYNKFYKSAIMKNRDHSIAVLQYTQFVFENSHVSFENLIIFEKTLKSILLCNGHYFIKVDKIKCIQLVKILIEKYKNEELSKNLSATILAVLCDIILDDQLLSLYGADEFSSFLDVLPLMLKKETISVKVIKTLTNLGKRKNEIFLKSLGEQIENVIQNIETVKISECEEIFEGRKLIMNLFYWIDYWDENTRASLINKIEKNITNEIYSSYFKFIIEKAYM